MTLRLAVAVLTSLIFAPAAVAGTVDVAMEAGTVIATGSDTADVVTLRHDRPGDRGTPGPGTGTDTTPASGCLRDPMSQAVTCPGAEGAIVHGEGGDDRVAGGAEEDVLDGGPGADALDGGAGDDDLAGGAGGGRPARGRRHRPRALSPGRSRSA